MHGAWVQNYNPLQNPALSTLCAALPVCLLCYLMAIRRSPAWKASLAGLALSSAMAIGIFGMPAAMLAGAVAHAVVFGLIRVVFTLAAAVFAYDLVESGKLPDLTSSISGLTADRRIQVLLIAFSFSAVIEGTGGGGSPVAIAAAMLIGLGFKPFDAAILGLLGNTAPVVFGAMGNPIRTLAAVTGLPETALAALLGAILAPAALLTPFCLVHRAAGWRGIREAWPGILTLGGSFAAIFVAGSLYLDIALVAVVAGVGSLAVTALYLRLRRHGRPGGPGWRAARAWIPFALLIVFVTIWGLPPVKKLLETTTVRVPVPGLHLMAVRQPPIVPAPQPEPAIFEFAWLAGAGTAGLLSGLLAGPLLGLSPGRTCSVFARSLYRIRGAVAAILGMLSLGFLTRYSGMDAVLGLALVNTGPAFPFFGTILGWLGVLITGTNAGSNALFGSLQAITARGLGLSELLMAAANAAGGVMGKMVNAQSLVVGCAAAGIQGQEGDLFRALLRYSLVLAAIIGLIVTAMAYVPGLLPKFG